MLGILLKRLWAICLLFVLISYFGGEMEAWASLTFDTTDIKTSYRAPDRAAHISGSDMVWRTDDISGTYQLYYRNLETGETKQLTNMSGDKSEPGIGGDYVTYIYMMRNVVLLNIRTGESTTITSAPSNYLSPTTDGHYVAYLDNYGSTIYVYDLETKTTKKTDKGIQPVVAAGKILYINFPSDNLQLYDIRTGEISVLMRPKDGYIDQFSGPAFNGKTAVWLQSMDKGGYQTRMLQVDQQDALPKLLAESDDMPKSPDPIAIGDNVAAWHQTVGGVDQVVAADLTYSKSNVLVSDAKLASHVAVYKDQVMLKDSDGNIVLSSLHVSGEPDTQEAPFVSAVPDLDEMPRATSMNSGYVFDGGELISSDKSVKVKFDQGTIRSFGDIVLEPSIDRDLQLTKALMPEEKMISLPWNITFPEARAGVTLSMSYIESRVPKDQLNKLGIYRLESGAWVYVGGLFEHGTNHIYTSIIKPGTYIVLSYNVPTPFVRDYWINKRITQMNSDAPIRVFLDGEEIQFHGAPVLQDGTTTVEFRPIFEKLGLQVNWEEATQTVTGQKDGKSIKLSLGKTEAMINDTKTDIPVAPFLYKGYTFVSLRYVGEAAGRKVVWDANLKAVYLYDPATEGKLYYSDGNLMYEGQLKDGHMNGKGKLYREDGTLWYDAEFKNDQVIGWGTIYFAGFSRGRDRTGELSIGQFLNGLPEGYVRDFDDSGYMFYEGQVKQGIFNGQGKYYVDNQLIYEGDFKENSYNGKGKYYIGGKLFYAGDFVNNMSEGYGKEYDQDGHLTREGEFRNGSLNGNGIVYYPSGAKRFEGQYVDDRANGNGKGYYENGNLKVEGQFEKSYIVKATYYYENNERYVGDFLNELPDGHGTLYDKNGNIEFQGQFKEGKPVK